MLGSFQRARQLLQQEVNRLHEANDQLQQQTKQQQKSGVNQELKATKARCSEVRAEVERLQRELGRKAASGTRDATETRELRLRVADARLEESGARAETLKEVQRAVEEERFADMQSEELDQLLRTEAALEGMLMVQWEMLEDLAQHVNLDPPWCCGLCSCRNPQHEQHCWVCESPKDGKTEMGNKAVEAYFEFRLHQEFLGRDPPPPPERRLPALQIALNHRREKWIEQEEVDELQGQLRDLATNKSLEPVLRAEAAYILFQLGDEAGVRMGRSLLKTMGENTDAVKRMNRRQRQKRVATLYKQLTAMKQKDMKQFRAWQEKMEQAQLRFRRKISEKQLQRGLSAQSMPSDRSLSMKQDLVVEDFDDFDE